MDSEDEVLQMQEQAKIQNRIALAETVLEKRFGRSKSGVRALSNERYCNVNTE